MPHWREQYGQCVATLDGVALEVAGMVPAAAARYGPETRGQTRCGLSKVLKDSDGAAFRMSTDLSLLIGARTVLSDAMGSA
jgi:hypothetical protein